MAHTVAHHEASDINQTLTQEETRKILTPFAFKIDQSLFGIALAAPSKRLFALLIDLFFITLLSDTSGEFLALAIAITLYRLGSNNPSKNGNKKKRGGKRRALLRFIAAFILFVLLLDVLPPLVSSINSDQEASQAEKLNNANEQGSGESDLSFAQTIMFSATVVDIITEMSDSDCKALTCWQNLLTPVVSHAASNNHEVDLTIEDTDLLKMCSSISEATELPTAQQIELTNYLFNLYKTTIQEEIKKEESYSQLLKSQETSIQAEQTLAEHDSDISSTKADKIASDSKHNKPIYSIIEWLKALIDDLGLGFGWAAFYFTMFTALWQGQTPGKKIMGIKVLQLDGTPLSLWDSFGRYGGYGAGIATGLLGFMQIYWDPNRQAIHDKISATVVIDMSKMKKH